MSEILKKLNSIDEQDGGPKKLGGSAPGPGVDSKSAQKLRRLSLLFGKLRTAFKRMPPLARVCGAVILVFGMLQLFLIWKKQNRGVAPAPLATVPSSTTPELVSAQGMAALTSDQNLQAVEIFSKLEAEHPDQFEFKANLAVGYRRLGKPKEALKILRALNQGLNIAAVKNNLALLEAEGGDLKTARRLLNEAGSLAPDSPEILINRARLAEQIQNWVEAIDLYEKILALPSSGTVNQFQEKIRKRIRKIEMFAYQQQQRKRTF